MGEGGYKLLLIGAIAAIALMLGCAALLGGVHLSGLGSRTTTQTEQAAQDGARSGRTSEVIGCVTRSLERQDACGDLDPVCQLEASAWSAGCLSEADDPTGICSQAPSPLDTEASVAWTVEVCAQLGDPPECLSRLGPIQQLCALQSEL
ncbi:MAG: hypothetical protein VX899_15520 [Myxococcota bacterium]|nr:hypothetical protein [Myxococcota bacterium]